MYEGALVVDLFAGPGGWDEAARQFGRGLVGVESDRDANATRQIAGHDTIRGDVSAIAPRLVAARASGLIASPPCPAFSKAGLRQGISHVAALLAAVHAEDWAARPDPHPLVWLVLEVGRWVDALDPEWVCCEQVPEVAPLWDAYAAVLARRGYATWSGVLSAEEYGVPQTRERAFLIASRAHPVGRPPATHQSFRGAPVDGRAPWVSMAAALGWAETARAGFPRRDDRGDSPDGYRERDWRDGAEPAFTVTEKARSWSVLNTGRDWKPGGTRADAHTLPLTVPAPTLTAKSGGQWQLQRPAEPRRDLFGELELADPTERRPLTIPEALVLQSFRADYPVQGNRSSAFKQIGNAVPPLLAAAVLRQVLEESRQVT